MTPAHIRKCIVGVIPEQVGTYTYSNGFSTEAIAVGNIPNDIKVTGIEVIIPNFPQVPQSLQTGDVFVHREEKWVIEIVNHGEDKGSFYTAIDRLLRFFPRAKGTDIPQNSILNSLPRFQLTLVHSDGYRKI